MGRRERPWERRRQLDGEISQSAGRTIGFAFALVQLGSLIVLGFNGTGLIVGFVLGIVAIVLLSKLVASSRASRTGGSPPPPLL
jgi:hypothetical protein